MNEAGKNATDSKLPPVLYKYFAFNEHAWRIFEHDEVYFSSPDMFNDPFDSRVCFVYEGSEQERAQSVMERMDRTPEDLPLCAMYVETGRDITMVSETVRRREEQRWRWMGVFSMSGKRDNILMWAHYADKHRGFCLGFRTDSEFFRECHRVNYPPDSKRPRCNTIRRLDPDEMAKAILTKAPDWFYEEEYRIIDYRQGPGVKRLPSAALSEVIIGCRMPPAHRALIRGWCANRRPGPSMYEAIPKDEEFGLHIEDLPVWRN